MIDILFLAHNRLDFTRACVAAMVANTDWGEVRRVVVYDDNSVDGTRQYLQNVRLPKPVKMIAGKWGGPVAVMNHYLLTGEAAPVFCKIDNDVLLPPGWLPDCLRVMTENPGVDLLGIEAFRTVVPAPTHRVADLAAHIGGIGLMRSRAFVTLPRPDGRFGFTQWQERSDWVQKAWLNPALPVALLDRLPMKPWSNLSRQYIAQGWQRKWDFYAHDAADLWAWWEPSFIET